MSSVPGEFERRITDIKAKLSQIKNSINSEANPVIVFEQRAQPLVKLPSPVKRPSVFTYHDPYKNDPRDIQASARREDFNSASFIERNFSQDQSERRTDSIIKVEPPQDEVRPYHEA